MCLQSPLLYRWNGSHGRVNSPAATRRTTALSAAGTTGLGLPGVGWGHMSPLSERVSPGWRRAASSPSAARHPKSPCMWAAWLIVAARLFCVCVCVCEVVECNAEVNKKKKNRCMNLRYFCPLSMHQTSPLSSLKRLNMDLLQTLLLLA